jgi:sec-independent protein translocase protein TatA
VVGDLLQPTHLLFVLVVALLVLGPKRLPEVGRALGRGLRDFRSAISGDDQHEQAISPAENSTSTPTAPPPAESPEETPPEEAPTEVVGADHAAEPGQTSPSTQPDKPVEAVSSSTRTDPSA